MKYHIKILKSLLLIWGTVSFLAAIVIVSIIFYQMGPGNRDNRKKASRNDVRFVLNWCNLGDDRIEKVLHSYISARSLTGDHLDGHAIQVTHLNRDEMNKNSWYRGDQLSGTSEEAVKFATAWLGKEEMSWFLSNDEIHSPDTYIYIVGIHMHGTRPNSAEIIFARPLENMIYYFDAKS